MNILLGVAGLLPAIVLCIYIYIKDRVEKEPIGLLIKLLISGVIICFPVVIFENYLLKIVGGNPILENFVGIALVEEGFKWLALIFITKSKKEFDSLFDGIIYATFVSLGFAAFENLLYVFEYGWVTAIARAITSVPGHTFFGVFMGYYYSMWNIISRAVEKEKRLKKEGFIPESTPEFSTARFTVLSLLLPVLVHGFYDYCCTIGGAVSTWIFIIFIVALYIYCFGKIKKMSVKDAPISNYVSALLARKYPELKAYIYNM